MSRYIKREDAIDILNEFIEEAGNRGDTEVEGTCMMARNEIIDLPSIEIDNDSLILSPEAYSHLCLSAAGKRQRGRCGTCKWRCGRKTSVGIECMQPDNQKKWQAKDTPHRECVARYKTAGTTCKRYERKDKGNE